MKYSLNLPWKYLSLYLVTIIPLLQAPKKADAHRKDGDELENWIQDKQDEGRGVTARELFLTVLCPSAETLRDPLAT